MDSQGFSTVCFGFKHPKLTHKSDSEHIYLPEIFLTGIVKVKSSSVDFNRLVV